ncbi:MAG: S-layer homology domain-containing protein [Candidatus Microthrix sp.]|nr:S-layer homology domain-containing protein [Candidatus Microthrix sp.]
MSTNAYYDQAVSWLVGAGVTGGTGPETYSPAQPVTRGQMATFLWNSPEAPRPRKPTHLGTCRQAPTTAKRCRG